jgi:YD repeat-containing protein
MAVRVIQPENFQLVSEILPSGNITLFHYDAIDRLIEIEAVNGPRTNCHSYMRFSYDFDDLGCVVTVNTSDERSLTYQFKKITIKDRDHYALTHVSGSHSIPCSYDYTVSQGVVTLERKVLPDGRFLQISYDNANRVSQLSHPSSSSGLPEGVCSLTYRDGVTEVHNAVGTKTCFIFDKRKQLTAIERYDDDDKLYRIDGKVWSEARGSKGLLLARTVLDGVGTVHSYRAFDYDKQGNVIEERLYGNLTGKQGVQLKINSKGLLVNFDPEECHKQAFEYSKDGFNLLTRMGDSRGGHTAYYYQAGTNRLIKKLISEKEWGVGKRTFQFYNDDAVCIRTIEDDGADLEPDQFYRVTERHINEISPKMQLPGVGLPLIVEEKAVEIKSRKQVPVKKLVNSFSPQGLLLDCHTYGSDGVAAFSVSKTYSNVGLVTSETDPAGTIVQYEYDENGNRIGENYPAEGRWVGKLYDYRNQLILRLESGGDLEAIERYVYDALGRQVAVTDRFDHTTTFEYDPFARLAKVVHPGVLDETEELFNPTFTYTYDIFGNVLAITDPRNHTIQKSYNLRGNPTRILYPDGSVELFKYDLEGSLHRSFSKDGIVTVYEYDFLGRETYRELSTIGDTGTLIYLRGERQTYNGFRLLRGGQEQSKGLITSLTFDPAGRPLTIIKRTSPMSDTDPGTRRTDLVYDALGRVIREKVWFDNGPSDFSWECFEYDFLGNVVEKRLESSEGQIVLRKGFSYDSCGRLVEEFALQDGVKKTLQKVAYDIFGEPVSYEDGKGNETRVIADYGSVPSKTLVNPLGVQTTIQFDALGRVSSIVKCDQMGDLIASQRIPTHRRPDRYGCRVSYQMQIVWLPDVLVRSCRNTQRPNRPGE